jgi:hypothetical protein
MASLADLLDPDQWILSGKSLLDFPRPEGNNEREAVKLILSYVNQRLAERPLVGLAHTVTNRTPG